MNKKLLFRLKHYIKVGNAQDNFYMMQEVRTLLMNLKALEYQCKMEKDFNILKAKKECL